MLQIMDKPQHGSACDETYFRFRCRIGSKRLLERLYEFHGEREAPPVEATTPQPLQPIPNETIAVAAEIAFPDWVNIITKIKSAVCREFDISMADLVSQRRAPKYVLPRQVGMYLCRKLTSRSLPEIGRRFGGRDHSTCHHGANKIERCLQTDEALRARVTALAELFGGSLS